MTDTIDNVAHVAPAAIADRLEELGAETIVECHDVLSHGPSRDDPKDHREARIDYWEGLYRRVLGSKEGETEAFDRALASLKDSYLSTEQLGSIARHLADQHRLVVWTTPTLQDRLALWMVFEACQQADVPARRIATAEPKFPSTWGEGYRPLRDLEHSDLLDGFEDIFYPEELYVDAGAQLWQTFASASPRKFAISLSHTEKFFPEIETLGEEYGVLFPRRRGEHSERMWLSSLDTALLGTLERGQWRTTFEVLGAEALQTFHFVDDLATAARLHDWADEAESPPYVRVRDSGRDGLFDAREFTLTERGERLLDEGFEPFDSAPIAEIGSARIHAGPQPWVRVVEDEYWWFERFERDED